MALFHHLLTAGLCTLPLVLAETPPLRLDVGASLTGFGQSSGSARCYNASIPVSINSTNTNILRGPPQNQEDLSQIIQDISVGATTSDLGGPIEESGKFKIAIRVCWPADYKSDKAKKTIQVLSHGVGFDKSYWDLASGYSYQQAAAQAGYATLAYDKLGTGESDHPASIEVVQGTADVEVLHSIISRLRSGYYGPNFDTVVGIGHSVGSITQLGDNEKYPNDLDISVLTGFSNTLQYLPLTLTSTTPVIARDSDPSRFGSLPPAYAVNPNLESFAQCFYFYPNYNTSILQVSVQNRATYSVGLLFTVSSTYAPAPAYKNPVAIQLGDRDYSFCGPSCVQPTDRSAAALATFFPNAARTSESFIVNKTGHAINAHYSRETAFSQIFQFLQTNGIH